MKYFFDIEQADALIRWYEQNKRSLPWRDKNNPYYTWISEIMLQQTRIEAVIDHFNHFIKEVPDISSLAECDDDQLMKLWEGLGYYSRARNLKKCAAVLVQNYHCNIPESYDELINLPGIGPYTAGAIASICFGKPEACVDGNVMRIMARYFLIEDDIRNQSFISAIREMVHDLLSQLSCSEHISSFNQGIMELGQTICVPNGTPHCEQCPFNTRCKAHLLNRTDTIPFRSKTKQRKIIHRTLLVIRDGERFAIHKRPADGLLAGLYEFPGFDGSFKQSEAIRKAEELGFHPLTIKRLPDAKHIFTHLEWHMRAYEIRCEEIDSCCTGDFILITKKELSSLAIPSAFKVYTEYYALRESS